TAGCPSQKLLGSARNCHGSRDLRRLRKIFPLPPSTSTHRLKIGQCGTAIIWRQKGYETMYLELDLKEVTLLTDLVEGRISELGPEIRRTDQSEMHDRLKFEREDLQKILHQLHESVWDPTT